MATGFPVKANYATGDVLTAANMNDLSGTLNYFNGVPYNKQAIINGGFDIWQRGTSGTANSTSAGAGYNADRWQNYSSNAITVSRQATSDTTNLPNIQYCARVQRNSGQTATTQVYTVQTIETANSIAMAGKTVTLSFYARAGANFSASSNILTSAILYGTGTDQNIFAFTGQTTVASQNNTLTTTWQRFSVSVAMPAAATEIGLNIYYTPTGTAGANDYFEITGVQLELGSVATPFSRAGGTIQGELAACQRYYYRQSATGNNSNFSFGMATSTTLIRFPLVLPVTMRTTPTSVDYSTIDAYDGSQIVPSALAIGSGDSCPTNVQLQATVTGATSTRPYILQAYNSTNGYVGVSAEL